MADSRETHQQELARLLLQKARQDLDVVASAADFEVVADEIIGFLVKGHIQLCYAVPATALPAIGI